MASDAEIGYGTKFQRSNGASPAVWTSWGEVTSITPPALTKGVTDVTHMDSPERYREFISTLRDAGQVTVEMNLVPGSASEVAILADYASNDAFTYRVLFPSTVAWEFSAIVTDYSTSVPLDDKMTATVTLKVTGEPAYL